MTSPVPKRTHGAATLSQTAMPTRERLMNAHGAFDIGGAGKHRIFRMLDTPLEQLRARGQVSEQEYLALWRLRTHWYLGHQAGSLRAIDLNRVRADYGETSSEQQIMHRDQFRDAMAVLVPIERATVETVVLREFGLNAAGCELGYRSPYRGRVAALDLLKSAAAKITAAWLSQSRNQLS